MKIRLIGTILAAAAVAALTGCTSSNGGDSDADTMPAPEVSPPPNSAPAPAGAPSTLSHSGLFAPVTPPAPGVQPAATPATIVLAVPALPADLAPVRPTGESAAQADHGEAEHDHDHEAPLTDGDVAVAWVTALYIGRFDDPAGTVAAALSALAGPSVVDARLASIPPLDAELHEARWPIITTVISSDGGWWHVEYVLKRTVTGHVGPSTSEPAAIDVHVIDGLVEDWTAGEVAS